MNEDQQAEYDSLIKTIAIHIHKLHEDCQHQPSFAFRAGELAAELKAEASRAKLRIEDVEKDMDKEIRANPEKYELAKTTETVMKIALAGCKEVQEAQTEVIDITEDAAKAASLCNALEHRRSMLKLEVELFVRDYWGDPDTQAKMMAGSKNAAQAKDADEFEEKAAEGRKKRRRRRREE